MVATSVSVGGGAATTPSFTVMTVEPPAGMSPEQSTAFETGAPQVKPFVPSAPTKLAAVAGGMSTRMCTGLPTGVAWVPALRATMV